MGGTGPLSRCTPPWPATCHGERVTPDAAANPVLDMTAVTVISPAVGTSAQDAWITSPRAARAGMATSARAGWAVTSELEALSVPLADAENRSVPPG